MKIAVMFMLGAFVGACGVVIVYCSVAIHSMRKWRQEQMKRPGYIDFTVSSASYEGRDASANPDSAEGLSGAGTSPRPRHLRAVDSDPPS